ncbi:fatty acid desaturase [Chondromyces crocatus]|uniref:Alkanal monooxygenase n=1 Tax=Chondromyces crocatus TaxID=52 RepID=A0A0K1EH72_CHOCO|nr:fatty acid desaturase [Chondromyces crocatus]AKT40032.1 alkanal monooxygenase [Chondromyces crocatus]
MPTAATTGEIASSGVSRATRREPWLVKHPAEWRQVGIIFVYLGLLAAMFVEERCRNVFFLGAACYFSFLNAVVIHNHLHQGIFQSRRLNMIWRCVLSFGALYPASANIPSHNLVHHHFDDDGQPDWAAPDHVGFRWHLLNLLHFPNVAGPNTFDGVKRWGALHGRGEFRRQYQLESAFAFGVTGALLLVDVWTTLFFIVIPQLWGARGILRINLIQHDRCDTSSEWNHSRNFVGRGFNWIMCNNGYHTIHHNRAGLHWSTLHEAHEREVVPRIDRSLDEPSMVLYLLRTFLFGLKRPTERDVAVSEHVAPLAELASRDVRRAEAEAASA